MSLPCVLRGESNKILCPLLGTNSGDLGAEKGTDLVFESELSSSRILRYNSNLNLEFISSFGSMIA